MKDSNNGSLTTGADGLKARFVGQALGVDDADLSAPVADGKKARKSVETTVYRYDVVGTDKDGIEVFRGELFTTLSAGGVESGMKGMAKNIAVN